MRRIGLAKPEIGSAERRAVDKVLRTGNLAQGRLVKQFEEEFAAAHGASEGIAVNSGTSGLHISLLALGVGPGDEVIVPAFTFAATANAVALTGAKPVFADVTPGEMTLDPNSVRSLIGPRTVGIIPVHLYGLPADMNALGEISSSRQLFVLEDAAQAHLAKIGSKKVGSMGAAAVFSFYPTKNMTTGEGGMITTSDEGLARKCRLLRNQGMEVRYRNEMFGLNNRMTEISAAIGIEQLKRLPKWTEVRRKNAETLLRHVPTEFIQRSPADYRHVYHQLTLRIPAEQRDGFRAALAKDLIDTDVYYPAGVHTLPAYGMADDLEVTAMLTKQVVSIPVRPSLSKSDLGRVSRALEGYFSV